MTIEHLAEPTVRVLIHPGTGAFSLKQELVQQLFERSPHYFDEPLPLSEFHAPGVTEPLENIFVNCVVRGEEVFFLKIGPELRVDPWLLQQFDALGSTALAGRYCSGLKAVDVPASAKWHIFEDDDGSEFVRENGRFWC